MSAPSGQIELAQAPAPDQSCWENWGGAPKKKDKRVDTKPPPKIVPVVDTFTAEVEAARRRNPQVTAHITKPAPEQRMFTDHRNGYVSPLRASDLEAVVSRLETQSKNPRLSNTAWKKIMADIERAKKDLLVFRGLVTAVAVDVPKPTCADQISSLLAEKNRLSTVNIMQLSDVKRVELISKRREVYVRIQEMMEKSQAGPLIAAQFKTILDEKLLMEAELAEMDKVQAAADFADGLSETEIEAFKQKLAKDRVQMLNDHANARLRNEKNMTALTQQFIKLL